MSINVHVCLTAPSDSVGLTGGLEMWIFYKHQNNAVAYDLHNTMEHVDLIGPKHASSLLLKCHAPLCFVQILYYYSH